MTPLSSETRQFINRHQSDDVRDLALQARKYPNVDMQAAITQIAGRQIATEKIPSWKEIEDIRYPKHLSLEQCSSEITARYKARLLQGKTLADLTGGFGVDCAFLAGRFNAVTYVERQKELCEIAGHNFRILRLNHISIRNEDGTDYLNMMSPADCIFLDPARRGEHGNKTVAISDCEPDVAGLEKLLLEKAGRKAPCRSRTVRKESREESRYEKPFCTYAVRARTGRGGRSGRRVRIPRHTVRHGRALGISPAGDALGRRV